MGLVDMWGWLKSLFLKSNLPFWEHKDLEEMNDKEWESLCDRCGKCCLIKLEDSDTGEIMTYDVACSLLNTKTAQCCDYKNRQQKVPDCIKINKYNIGDLHWLPETCAYRLLWIGQPLPNWHPLISGSYETVAQSGNSVRNKVINEHQVEDMPKHINQWMRKKNRLKDKFG